MARTILEQILDNVRQGALLPLDSAATPSHAEECLQELYRQSTGILEEVDRELSTLLAGLTRHPSLQALAPISAELRGRLQAVVQHLVRDEFTETPAPARRNSFEPIDEARTLPPEFIVMETTSPPHATVAPSRMTTASHRTPDAPPLRVPVHAYGAPEEPSAEQAIGERNQAIGGPPPGASDDDRKFKLNDIQGMIDSLLGR